MSSESRKYPDPEVGSIAISYRDNIIAYVTSKADLQSTAQSLTAQTNEAFVSGNDNVGILVEVLWTEIFDAVERVPSSSYVSGRPDEHNATQLNKLVDIVDAVRQSPAPSAPAGHNTSNAIYPLDGKAQLWSSLPGSGVEARERWNVDPSSLPGNTAATNSWTNLNSFIALLWSRSPVDQTPEPLDFALYAIWTLRQTLEEPQDQKTLCGLVPAAAAWVCIESSAKKIWQCCQQGRSWPPENKRAPAKTGPLWDEAGKEREDGFSRERWHFWKGRFVQISEMNGVGEEVRKTSLAASQGMGEIVGQS